MVPVGLEGLLRVTATGLSARISKLLLVLTIHWRLSRVIFSSLVTRLIRQFPLYVLKLSVIGLRAINAALRRLTVRLYAVCLRTVFARLVVPGLPIDEHDPLHFS